MYQDGLPLVILDYDQKLVLDYLTKTGNQKLISDFIFPGYIHSEEMPLLYNIAKLFLYPSLRESFGLPILEAMACGVPVITSNTSSMPEVAGDSALFVNPFNFQDIRDKIIQFQQDESLQSRMKQGGLKRAANFTWKASAEQLLSIYNSVIF
jgi:glycosyltransferase involved in cell wall biosynthesis